MARFGLILGLTAGLLTSACVTAQPAYRGTEGTMPSIHAAAFTRDTILLTISSNGCTDKDDIRPLITRLRTHTVMAFQRLEEDTCRFYKPEGVQLQWSFAELGLEPGTPIEVINPYSQPRGTL